MTTKGTNPNYVPPAQAAMARNSGKGIMHGSTIEWGSWGNASVISPAKAPATAVSVTPEEIAAIKRKAGTSTIDLGRAESVKAAIQGGCDTLAKVEEALSGQYRRTQVSIYRAALVELWGADGPSPTEMKQ